jgi:diguanylate cyclase (GGDEF)-like protein/PAS domain S-box-containing protein
MNDPAGTNTELIQEISCLNQRIRELELSEAECKRASEALRKSEEYFRVITQNSSDIIFIVDGLGTITYASPSVERFLGYKPDELIGKRSLDLILSDDKPKAAENFGRALLTKEIAIPDVFRIRHKDGTERILEGFGNNLLDNPVVAGFVMNVRDVTNRRKTEEALHKSEERYRQLVENASDIVFTTDSAGRVAFVNPAVIRITGYEEEEVVGKQYTILIRPDMRDEAMKFFGRQFVKGIQNTYSEYPTLTKDGQEVWFGQNTQLIWEDGNVTGFQVVARDITDRKRIEKELRDSEERYRRIVETSSDAVLLRSRESIIYANPAALKLFRANHPEDLIGKRYLDLVHPDDRATSTERVKKTMEENWIAPPREHQIVALDGQVVHVESTGVPVQYRGETHVFGIFRDISERREAEKALRESEKRYRELSIVDDLTQLYNSRHFYFQLRIELDRSNRYEQPLTLLLLDLDNFKAFNDAYGHVEGDQVLWRLGQVVKRCLRETDFAFRYGGEEFTILLPVTTSADGAFTAERIRTEFKKEAFYPAPGPDVHVTVSIGLAQYKPQEEMKVFVHRVDQLMYQGKKNGKDRVCSES